MSIVLSRCLSLSVILGALGGREATKKFIFALFVLPSSLSLTVKFPQIIKILRNYSTEGLTYLACLLELGAVTFSSAYNYDKGFPFRYSSYCYIHVLSWEKILLGIRENFSLGVPHNYIE